MSEYRAEAITEARPADETSVRVTFATGAGHVVLSMDWRLASELVDTVAIVTNQVRHSLAAPDTRAQRWRLGCYRLGIVLGVLTFLPALWGSWHWIRGTLDPDGWMLVVAFVLAAPAVFAVIWSIGWIVAAFIGSRQRQREAV